MTRKDFEKIAQAFFKESRRKAYSDETLDALHSLAYDLADIFKGINPNFNHGKFMAAVDGENVRTARQVPAPSSLEDVQEIERAASEQANEKIEAVSGELTATFEQMVKSVLESWNARFKNHKFSAFTGMGSFQIRVSPPILGESTVEYIRSDRGAIGEIVEIANAIHDWYIHDYDQPMIQDLGWFVK